MTDTYLQIAEVIKDHRLTYEDDPGADVPRINHINNLLDNLAIDIADTLFISKNKVFSVERNEFLVRAGVL